VPIGRLFLRTPKDGRAKLLLNGLLVGAVLVGFVALSVARVEGRYDFTDLWTYRTRLAMGFGMTLAFSVLSMAASLLIGFASATGSRSRVLPVRYLCRTYVNVIRGTPLLMQIYLFFYIIGDAWGVEDRLVAGVLILSIFEGAYISEILRGGLDSIEGSQLEIARAVGFTPAQATRLIVMPQLLRRTLPALAGQFASIIKDSSLLSVISIVELTQTIKEVNAATFAFTTDYLFLGVLYFALTFPVSLLSRALEKRFAYEN
jgi:polar amino acid transport system permease protein